MGVARASAVDVGTFPLIHYFKLTRFDYRCQRANKTIPIDRLRAIFEILAMAFPQLGRLVFDRVHVEVVIRNQLVQEATDLNVVTCSSNLD